MDQFKAATDARGNFQGGGNGGNDLLNALLGNQRGQKGAGKRGFQSLPPLKFYKNQILDARRLRFSVPLEEDSNTEICAVAFNCKGIQKLANIERVLPTMLEISDSWETDAAFCEEFSERFSLKDLSDEQKVDFLNLTDKFMSKCGIKKVNGIKVLATKRAGPQKPQNYAPKWQCDGPWEDNDEDGVRHAKDNMFAKEKDTPKVFHMPNQDPEKRPLCPDFVDESIPQGIQPCDLFTGLRFFHKLVGHVQHGTVIGFGQNDDGSSSVNVAWDNGAMESVDMTSFCAQVYRNKTCLSPRSRKSMPSSSAFGQNDAPMNDPKDAAAEMPTEPVNAKPNAVKETAKKFDLLKGVGNNKHMSEADLSSLLEPATPRLSSTRTLDGNSANPAEKQRPRKSDGQE